MQITKDNIIETLQYNGFERENGDQRHTYYRKIIGRVEFFIEIANKYYFNKINSENYCSTDDFDEFLSFVQKRIELNPLPEFDFVKYMCDNGFKEAQSHLESICMNITVCEADNTTWLKNTAAIFETTKTTADMFININKQLEQANVNKTASC